MKNPSGGSLPTQKQIPPAPEGWEPIPQNMHNVSSDEDDVERGGGSWKTLLRNIGNESLLEISIRKRRKRFCGTLSGNYLAENCRKKYLMCDEDLSAATVPQKIQLKKQMLKPFCNFIPISWNTKFKV